MENTDLELARSLQEQFEKEQEIERGSNLVYKTKTKNEGDNSRSLVDPSWELIDPTPNVHHLFIVFDHKFFWGKLEAVSVSWSKRMTSCAGICSYNPRGGLCQITLSEPLLKLRPRKDFIETLLHEMIHAYLFVTKSDRDRDGHGPQFCEHMYRINKEAGTEISIYHDFHDEVGLYKQHWWRCNGPCRTTRPFFGIVRRATNRAPGPNDTWWKRHLDKCNGTFIKIKEPENYKSKNKTKSKENKPLVKNSNNDIRKYMNTNTNNKIVSLQDLTNDQNSDSSLKNINGTVISKSNDPISKQSTSSSSNKNNSIVVFGGEGRSLVSNPSQTHTGNNDYTKVREKWLNKFLPQNGTSDNKRPLDTSNDNNKKRLKTDSTKSNASLTFVSTNDQKKLNKVDCPACGTNIDQMLINSHLDLCLRKYENVETCFVCNVLVPKEFLEKHIDMCLNKSLEEKTEQEIPTKNNSLELKKKKCDICYKEFEVKEFEKHSKHCVAPTYRETPTASDANAPQTSCLVDETSKNTFDLQKDDTIVSCLVCAKNISKIQLGTHLDECMEKIIKNSEKSIKIDTELEPSCSYNSVNCPFCLELILENKIEEHLNICYSIEKET